MPPANRTSTLPAGDDAGKLLLRVLLGVLILLHGISKLVNGDNGVTGMLGKMGLPEALGHLVYVGEVVAPLLLILGFWTRAAALVVAVNMVVAVLLAHTGQLLSMGRSGGYALELQAMFLFTAIAIALLGAGRHSFGGAAGRWN
jgi:putative oxidoreductase